MEIVLILVGLVFGLILMYFVLPALISLAVSEFMRRHKFIAFGDMKLDV